MLPINAGYKTISITFLNITASKRYKIIDLFIVQDKEAILKPRLIDLHVVSIEQIKIVLLLLDSVAIKMV